MNVVLHLNNFKKIYLGIHKKVALVFVWIHAIFGMRVMISLTLMKSSINLIQFLGLENLLCMHINDSKNELGAHKDRHENIGKGYIGFDVLYAIVHHPKLEHVTKILETPFVDGKACYKEEISALR